MLPEEINIKTQIIVVEPGPPEAWAFDMSILAGSVAESSIAMYTRDFKAYLAFAQTPEQAMQAATLARWRTHLAQHSTLSPHTINRMLSAVKRLMKEAAVQGYIEKSVIEDFKHVDGVKVEALRKRLKPHARTRIEPQDMRRLTESPNPTSLIGLRDRALLHTLAGSGLRAHEAASLTPEQIIVSSAGYQLRVLGKNDAEPREAPLTPEAYQWIARWLAARPVASPYIFTAFAGRGEGEKARLTAEPMQDVSIWRAVKKYAARCHLAHIKPHDFRRFVGTQLAAKDPRKAQLALGHKKITTTYEHYVLDSLEVGVTDGLY